MNVGRMRQQIQDLQRSAKTYEFEADASRQRINASFVLLALEGLDAYLRGESGRAADEFSTLADELSARLSAGAAIEPQA